jgi:hypothetical protein
VQKVKCKRPSSRSGPCVLGKAPGWETDEVHSGVSLCAGEPQFISSTQTTSSASPFLWTRETSLHMSGLTGSLTLKWGSQKAEKTWQDHVVRLLTQWFSAKLDKDQVFWVHCWCSNHRTFFPFFAVWRWNPRPCACYTSTLNTILHSPALTIALRSCFQWTELKLFDFFFCQYWGVWTQPSVASQVLYHLSHIPNPFLL